MQLRANASADRPGKGLRENAIFGEVPRGTGIPRFRKPDARQGLILADLRGSLARMAVGPEQVPRTAESTRPGERANSRWKGDEADATASQQWRDTVASVHPQFDHAPRPEEELAKRVRRAARRDQLFQTLGEVLGLAGILGLLYIVFHFILKYW